MWRSLGPTFQTLRCAQLCSMIPGHLSFTFSQSVLRNSSPLFSHLQNQGLRVAPEPLQMQVGAVKSASIKLVGGKCWFHLFLLRFVSSESEMKKNHFSKCYKCPTWKVNVLFLIVTNLPSEEQICMNHVAAVLHQYQKEPRHCLFRLVHTHTQEKKICLFTAEKVRLITVHLYTWLSMPNYHNNYSSSWEILI